MLLGRQIFELESAPTNYYNSFSLLKVWNINGIGCVGWVINYDLRIRLVIDFKINCVGFGIKYFCAHHFSDILAMIIKF